MCDGRADQLHLFTHSHACSPPAMHRDRVGTWVGVHSATGNAKNHRKPQMLWVNSNDQTQEPVPPENHCGRALACHSVNVSWQVVEKITDYGS